MDLITFNERVKQGRLDFHPGVVYGFEDEDAAPYFKACGWADDVDDSLEPAVVISIGELDIDPLTVWGTGEKKGMFVMPDRAAAHLRNTGYPHITDEWAESYTATFIPVHELVQQLEAEGHL